MSKTLVMFHTGIVVINPLLELARGLMPGTRIINLMDDGVVADIERAGSITPDIVERVTGEILTGAHLNPEAVLVTCSSISPIVDVAQQLTQVPVLKIDEPMAETAVKSGPRVGVVATLETTLRPTTELIRSKAQELGLEIEITPALCSEAFVALSAGDPKKHDETLLHHITSLAEKMDVVVLAQASMARIVPSLPEGLRDAVLTSPPLGVARAARVLGFPA